MAGKILIVIPARQASQRFPSKPLAPLRGATGVAKPLVQRSWEAAKAVGADRVIVASDSDDILDAARGFGAEAMFTSPDCRNGTERCAEVLGKLDEDPELIVNLQGDAPLTPGYFVDALIDTLRAEPRFDVATPVVRCSEPLYAKLLADEKRGIVGGTFAAVSSAMRAHYFSKRIIPHFDPSKLGEGPLPVLLHIGLYAYRPRALRRYVSQEPSALEELEGLEQLRFLDSDSEIRVVEVEPPKWEIWELNNPSDTPRVEASLKAMGAQ